MDSKNYSIKQEIVEPNTLQLQYKPDFKEVCKRWDAFWEGEILNRPLVSVTSCKEGAAYRPLPQYPTPIGGDYEQDASMFDAHAAGIYYGGEAIPHWRPDFGPDQFSAFLGAELRQGEGTSWVVPFVKDWRELPPLHFGAGKAWPEMLRFVQETAQVSKGKWLVGMLDFHTHLDSLLAIRGGTQLCMDLVDYPDKIDRILKELSEFYPSMYEAVYEAGNMKTWGSTGWAPFYCRGKFATIQCDFIYLISPEHFRRFALPYIEQEASFLDHCVYHLDGEGALNHLNDLLAVESIDVIQWIPGADKAGPIAWIDLFKQIQKAGKGLEIRCTAEEVKLLHRELGPEKVLYCVNAASESEARKLLSWLSKNT